MAEASSEVQLLLLGAALIGGVVVVVGRLPLGGWRVQMFNKRVLVETTSTVETSQSVGKRGKAMEKERLELCASSCWRDLWYGMAGGEPELDWRPSQEQSRKISGRWKGKSGRQHGKRGGIHAHACPQVRCTTVGSPEKNFRNS